MNGTGTDLSELTKEELASELSATVEELRRTRDELDRARNALAASVSQELRTPLASIQGYIELLEDGELGRLSPTTTTAVRTIGRNAARLASLLDELLHPQSAPVSVPAPVAELVDVDLGELVRQSQVALQSVARIRRLQLSVSLAPHLHRIRADRELIEQVVLNLVGNALKFTPEGGTVRVTLEDAGDGVELTVADNGIGIPESEIGSLFAPRFRSSLAVQRGIEGQGLGLVTSKEIVDRHDGRLTVESTEGVGTTVRVRLPADPDGQRGFAAWRRSHQRPTNGSTNGTNP